MCVKACEGDDVVGVDMSMLSVNTTNNNDSHLVHAYSICTCTATLVVCVCVPFFFESKLYCLSENFGEVFRFRNASLKAGWKFWRKIFDSGMSSAKLLR